MKKALIYDPYLDGLGGGERYTTSFAQCLLKNNWQVDVSWDDKTILEKIKERFQIDLHEARIIDNAFTRLTHVIERILVTQEYDFTFFLSDGSIPLTFGKKNILHFQVPFTNIRLSKFDKWKLVKFQHIICNSQFTKQYIDKTYGVISEIIYPPVNLISLTNNKKEKMILSVGRFHPLKKQEILIKTFKKFNELKGLKLVLVGGVMPADKEYLDSLYELAKGHNIEFQVGIDYQKLCDLYNKALIYWHATGFGEEKPENMEHFGISTVEAMSAGCVPIVYRAGGQTEIITNGETGYLWETELELIKKTTEIVENKQKRDRISSQAVKRSQDFSVEKFCQKCATYF